MPSKTTSILALDPGEKVGWNTAHVEHDRGGANTLHIDKYGILRMKTAGVGLFDPESELYVPAVDVLIFERWVLTAKGAQDNIGLEMESSQFVGMVRLAAWLTNGQTTLKGQLPKDMNTARLVLQDRGRADYNVIAGIIEAAPARHDDSHYVSSILHTVKYFHKEFR